MKGRDCIERNSAHTFNCEKTCEGIYADVQWASTYSELETDNNAKLQELIAEYRKIKSEYVRHIRFSPAFSSSAFGRW